jgi:hypothetical protein
MHIVGAIDKLGLQHLQNMPQKDEAMFMGKGNILVNVIQHS